MRRLAALALVLALAGCVATPEAAPPAAPPITETALPASAAVAPPEAPATDTVAEPAPVAEPDPAAAPLPAPDPPMLAQQRTACQRGGGQLMARGNGLYACVHPTRDAGRSCSAARDCEGLCLARSGTCAPFTPIYGCQEVFTLPGLRETLCTE